jgi:hypothetical protein
MRGLRELDRILRGEATDPSASGESGLSIALGPLVLANLSLAAFYGLCMGVYGLFGRAEPEFRQLAANAIKVPLLFVLTILVTFPSLYVFNALVRSPLGIRELARLLAAAMGVLLAVLAAFGPIVAFFSITTTSYPFIVLLNVTVFTVAAAFGLTFLLRALEKLTLRPGAPRTVIRRTPVEECGLPREPDAPRIEQVELPPRPIPDPAVRTVVQVWLIAFALVGVQMSWVLRPFIGSPTQEFTWLRPREASFFEAVLRSLRALFGG